MSFTADFFFNGMIIGMGILIYWFIAMVFFSKKVHSLHRRWFPMRGEDFFRIQYLAMAIFKIGLIIFFVIPYFSLLIQNS